MEDDDDEKKTSMKHFVLSELDKFFVGHIPIDSFKELAPTCKSFEKPLNFSPIVIVVIPLVDLFYLQFVFCPAHLVKVLSKVETARGLPCARPALP